MTSYNLFYTWGSSTSTWDTTDGYSTTSTWSISPISGIKANLEKLIQDALDEMIFLTTEDEQYITLSRREVITIEMLTKKSINELTKEEIEMYLCMIRL